MVNLCTTFKSLPSPIPKGDATLVHIMPQNMDKCSAVADMGDHLATIDMHGPKSRGAAVPLFGGIVEGRKLKQLQNTSTDVERPVTASLIITLEGKR